MENKKYTLNKYLDESSLPAKEDYYYDAMDLLNEGNYSDAIKLLKQAIKIDPHYVGAYVGMFTVYSERKNKKKYREYVDKAFEETKQKFPKWPQKLLWGIIDNRQYLRAICEKACLYWDEGDKEKAEQLFRLLLKLNPNDNQGVRYLIAGMFRGLKEKDINRMFDEGNENQNWDHLEKLVEDENKKYNFWQPPNY